MLEQVREWQDERDFDDEIMVALLVELIVQNGLEQKLQELLDG